MKTLALAFVVALPAFALPMSSASAQTPPTSYPLHEMNFDMWCQETMHYPPDRCDKRLPKDDAQFKSYRSTVEKYEMQRLKNQRQTQEWNKEILHNDPLDNPQGPNSAPGSAGTIPQPQ